jgi:hypothetical protein
VRYTRCYARRAQRQIPVRLEDKSLERRDSVDNEQAELLEQANVDEFGEQRFLTRAQGGAHTPEDFVHGAEATAVQRADMFTLMREILDGNTHTHQANLAPLHQKAIDLLQGAVSGRHPRDQTFIFAEDRRMMLEQSLAALQPMLAMGQFSMSLEAASLTDSFQRLVGDVNSLRHTLSKLEATQEEVEAKPVAKLAKSDSDDDEEDDDAADDDDEAADEADATLASNDALGATPKPKPDEAP